MAKEIVTKEIVTIDTLPTDNRMAVRQRSLWWHSFRRLRRNRGAMLGSVVIMALILIALLAPVLATHDPTENRLRDMLLPPSREHLMGTDGHGRDMFSRVIFGTRFSLQLGLISVGIAILFGGILGLIAGYYSGLVTQFIMRAMDVMLSFPGILLAMAVIAILGPGLSNVMIAVGISWIPAYARLVRGSTVSARENEYVLAARSVGCPSLRIVFRHLMPNVIAPLIVLSSLNVGAAILVGASLSFLGLGAQPPTPEWGAILNSGRRHIRTAWWIMTFPGLAIMITVMATNLLGDGLREALDPRLGL